MKIFHTIEEFRRCEIPSPAFVPTMGALHEGHLALIEAAKKTNFPVVVSIFVNPLQFGPGEDYERYPRSFDEDVTKAGTAGADIIFNPSADEMYRGSSTVIHLSKVSEGYEGAFRPGHFDGVATVVAKLFNIVSPRLAFFGRKDLQQCAVIQRMVDDLFLPVTLRICDTIREADGLAKSSRNIFLSQSERTIAPALYQNLQSARQSVLAGDDVASTLLLATKNIETAGLEVQYLDLVDKNTFEQARIPDKNAAFVAAVKLKQVRLIDNLSLFDAQ